MASLPKDMRRATQCRYHRANPIFRRSGVLDFQSANRMMTRRALLLATAGMAALIGLSARGMARFRPSEYSRGRGLRAAISVSEDRFGIPHVRAASLHDAYWAQGRRREALFQWRRALTLGPEGDEGPKIEAKIGDGLAPQPAAERRR